MGHSLGRSSDSPAPEESDVGGESDALGPGTGLLLRVPGQLAALADLRHPVGRRGPAARGDRDDRDVEHGRSTRGNAWRQYAALGESYFYAIIGVELTLVMLAAPAATAGAICVDRARGTLTHMLATDLSDPEIVLGKLAARLLPVLGLVACSWPVLAICSLLGGIDPHGADARVRDHPGRRPARLHDGDGAVGVGP